MTDINPDFLRTPQNLCNPDPRNQGYATYDERESIDNHYKSIDQIKLNNEVPEDIIIQFETSKNLLLYAWFVYRFYPIARSHALTVLELALKERFEDEIPADDTKYRHGKDKRLMLSSLLRYCKDNNILRDEKFKIARHKAAMNADSRNLMNNIRLMDELGVSELKYDDSKIEIKEEDWNFDHVKVLLETLPKIRNSHAHGSTMLDKSSRGILLTVAEIINQLWP
ncbi:MAG: hypothetical protein ABW077_09390 [Candidatus Thiodiazotropha endolucinida]